MLFRESAGYVAPRSEVWQSTLGRGEARVLLVDDDPDILSMVARLLEEAGYRVDAFSALGPAREALQRSRYHLVVTDLYLSGDELGYQLAEVAGAQRPAVPMVLLTGKPSLSSAKEAMRSHVCDILEKPVDHTDLLATCQRAIQECTLRSRADELEALNKVLAQVLPRAIEAKDPLTRGHADRVVQYADVLGRRLDVSEADRESLRLACLLHDVGKIGVPEQILRKEGPLTREEREVIQRHPTVGFEILEPVRDEKVRLWVYQHHERWDGKGYPNGLRGEDVELPGRILILAEVYDALAEARSYKEAWDNQRIVAFFRSEAGKHFDPDLSHVVADGLEACGRRFFAPSPGMLF
ncbi:MAG: HD domain-containing protein [Planctomycetes bacterium]|nr:HD domain-containing protein [Planctomycetota bacterium]